MKIVYENGKAYKLGINPVSLQETREPMKVEGLVQEVQFLDNSLRELRERYKAEDRGGELKHRMYQKGIEDAIKIMELMKHDRTSNNW